MAVNNPVAIVAGCSCYLVLHISCSPPVPRMTCDRPRRCLLHRCRGRPGREGRWRRHNLGNQELGDTRTNVNLPAVPGVSQELAVSLQAECPVVQMVLPQVQDSSTPRGKVAEEQSGHGQGGKDKLAD